MLAEIPPPVLQQLLAMPPDQVAELVKEGQLPPEVFDLLAFVQQQQQQGGMPPPGVEPGLPGPGMPPGM